MGGNSLDETIPLCKWKHDRIWKKWRSVCAEFGNVSSTSDRYRVLSSSSHPPSLFFLFFFFLFFLFFFFFYFLYFCPFTLLIIHLFTTPWTPTFVNFFSSFCKVCCMYVCVCVCTCTRKIVKFLSIFFFFYFFREYFFLFLPLSFLFFLSTELSKDYSVEKYKEHLLSNGNDNAKIEVKFAIEKGKTFAGVVSFANERGNNEATHRF